MIDDSLPPPEPRDTNSVRPPLDLVCVWTLVSLIQAKLAEERKQKDALASKR